MSTFIQLFSYLVLAVLNAGGAVAVFQKDGNPFVVGLCAVCAVLMTSRLIQAGRGDS